MNQKQQEVQVPLGVPTPKEDITVQNLDDHLDIISDKFILNSKKTFFTRLWFAITNPFTYIFGGYIRY